MYQLRKCRAGLLILLGLALVGCQKNEEAALPVDLLALVPADAALLVTATSLDDFNAQWHALNDTTSGPALLPGEAAAAFDIGALLAEKWPGFETAVATDQPLAIAMGVPALMTNQFDLTVIFAPRQDSATDALADGEPFTTQLSRGGFMAVSNADVYAPADTVVALASDLLPGVATVAIDLEGIIGMYRPMVEMGIGMAAMAQADPDDPTAAMTAAESAALLEMLRALMDSARRLDLALASDADEARWAARFDLIEGSPLVPGPHPDFAPALALAAGLPDGADLYFAAAMDQSAQMAIFRDFYITSLERELATLPSDQAAKLQAWFTDYLEMSAHMAVPMAAAESIRDDVLVIDTILRTPDAEDLVDNLDDLITDLNDLGLGVAFASKEIGPIDGFAVRDWQVTTDATTLPLAFGDGDQGLGETQMAQAVSFIQRMGTRLRVAHKGDLIVLSTQIEDAAFGNLLADAGASGAPPAALAELARAAGPNVRQVVAGDVGAFLGWALATAMPEPGMQAALLEHPVPFRTYVSQDGPRILVAGTLDVKGARLTASALMEAGKAMEAPAP